MSLKKYFCSSPWFHVRINNQGQYEFCRWASKGVAHTGESAITFFQKGMAPYREQLVSGQPLDACKPCYEMEEHNKVSGRQKQLLKTGVTLDNFNKTLASSPWLTTFLECQTNLLPQDWQIDLGNYCNSACVFCRPEYSSLLARDYKKIGLIQDLPLNSWCSDQGLLDSFIGDLIQSPKLRYLHFIGGETLIIPAFKQILDAVVANNKASTATVGFTTNLTVWNDSIIQTLLQFENVHVGLSIESLTLLNDYARWPSEINQCKETLDRWVAVAKEHNWLVQLRTTPTLLTIRDLHTVYEYALENNAIVESCNFLQRPAFLRPTVLPQSYRDEIILSLVKTRAKIVVENLKTVVNIRNPNTTRELLDQDLNSYINYLTDAPDESHLLPQAVEYLKKLESLRGNSVLDYLPEYEDILRTAGY